ncbi:MAG: FAD/NAD(P)-binding protein [Luteolibacter sp.]
METKGNASSQTLLPIAVIGGGFSGTLTAIHLSRRLPETPVILFEESGEVGPGLAYQTSDPNSCLNIPAGKMSAFVDQPDHFLQYARRTFGDNIGSGDFLPRKIYGNYLQACLAETLANNPFVKVDNRRVVDVTGIDGQETARIVLKDQSTLDAASVVLASGNQGSAFAASIWASHTVPARDPASIDAVGGGEDVLIVGSGLTMIDAVLELDRRGKAGTIHAVSRNALLPKPYAPAAPLDEPDLDHLPDSNLRQSLRLFRKAIREHEAKGGNWRDLFAAIRSSTPSLWQELSEKDRAKFLRLVSPFWEIHRHQCSPENFEKITRLIDSGKLVLHKGTIVSVEHGENRKRLGLASRSRDAATRWIGAAHILDATGPARDLNTIRHPLIQNLLRRGFLKPDAHRLGADTAADYHAIGRGGQPSKWLYIVGPMLRARYFEATAVNELRLHAAAVAARVEASYRDRFLAEIPVGV